MRSISTRHGDIELPVFMPVGTKGTVKAVPPDMLHKLEVSVILGNTYHLFLRPGHKLITEFGGLHDFMGWNRPILTDSGGYQVFSLARLRKITEEGVCFRSHIDGSKHLITPEISMQVQDALSADIRMVFDECPPCDAGYSYVRKSLELTARWAVRSKKEWERLGKGGSLFGIIQGGMHSRLRKESLDRLLDTGFDGYAIGGLSVGEPKPDMYRILNDLSSHLPSGKPVYLMGVGEPEDILFAVKNGVHMFDCVIPTRNARNGTLYTFNGRISIKRSCFFSDKKPVEETCDCYTCRNFSRAYLRHLFISKELLSYYLNTIHNIRFFMRFMAKIRSSINNSVFNEFYTDFLNNYNKSS